jgi:glycosyltransferase involved in cell wall biosynthesis
MNLVFTGSMDWLPNDDAIRYFVESILPIIRAEIPAVTLTVVGRLPYPWLQELAQKDGSIVVTGRVPDVRPYMEAAGAFIVPMRVGGGTRLKIYEAMAMEVPVISTSVGAEGLPVKHGDHLLAANSPKAFARAVVEIATDAQVAQRIASNAAELVRQKFGWNHAAARFAEICEAVIQRRSEYAGHGYPVGGHALRVGLEADCE